MIPRKALNIDEKVNTKLRLYCGVNIFSQVYIMYQQGDVFRTSADVLKIRPQLIAISMLEN